MLTVPIFMVIGAVPVGKPAAKQPPTMERHSLRLATYRYSLHD